MNAFGSAQDACCEICWTSGSLRDFVPVGDGGQRGFKVGDKVCFGFEADRKPQHAVTDARGAARLGAHAHMRHRRRMRDEAFDAAEGFGQSEHLDGFDESSRRFGAARQFKAQHGAEAGLLGLGDFMPRMRGEAGIVDGNDFRAPLKEACDGRGAGLLLPNSRKQGAQSAQRQIGVERRARHANRYSPRPRDFRIPPCPP